MDAFEPKGLFQASVQFFTYHFLPPTFHPPGLHDDAMFQGHGVFFRQFQKREGNSDQKGRNRTCFQVFQTITEPLRVVQEKAVLRMSAGIHQSLDHVDQRGILPLGIGWKQTQDPIMGRIPIRTEEGPIPGKVVQSRLGQVMMGQSISITRPAAPENELLSKPVAKKLMGLEKTNGQKGDLFDGTRLIRTDP